jgi:hypothetical protein
MTQYYKKNEDGEFVEADLSQEDINQAVRERVDRVNRKYADYDEIKKQNEEFSAKQRDFEDKINGLLTDKANLEDKVKAAELATEKVRIVNEFKLSDDLADFVEGDTAEEMRTRAEKLAHNMTTKAIDIDKTEKAYAAKCEKNRQNRLTTNVDERERTITKVDERPQNKNIKEKENIKETTLKGSKEKPLARFTPPTVEEVDAYCKERGNRVNAQRFVDFYAAKGWKIGQNPMKDWKAAVRTWEQRDDSPACPAKVVSAQQYTQRQYTEDELLAVSDDLLAEARANRGKTA